MKVALFGGTGFVGSYIIDELLKNGHEPVVLVRDGSESKLNNSEKCKIISGDVNIPIASTKDYTIPNFVNEYTLVIANSYSGNTEETLSALEKCQAKGAEIAVITSGGKLKLKPS